MSDSEEDDVQIRTVKITIVGEPGTGKTSLCSRYLGLAGGAGSAGGTQGAEVMSGQCFGVRPAAPVQLCDVAGAAIATDMLANYLFTTDVVVLPSLRSPSGLIPPPYLFGRQATMLAKLCSGLKDKAASAITVIEKYTENVRFCIICNYLGKIIPALQSRCTRFRFAPLQQSQIVPRLQEIANAEGVKMSEDGLKALLTLSGGDMRKVLNTLQSTWMAYRDVTEDNVYTCVGHPLRSDINSIVNWLMNENDFAACFKNIQDLKLIKGLALSDILTEVHSIIQRVKLPPEVLVSLLIKMADAEARLSSGCSERIELASLIAAFQVARDQVTVEDA